jgi:hypothetical protein
MDNGKTMTKEDYNNIPVYYCKSCGSLKIKIIPAISGCYSDFCDDCGSTSIGKTSIESWQVLQKTTFKPLYKDRPVKKFNPFKEQ